MPSFWNELQHQGLVMNHKQKLETNNYFAECVFSDLNPILNFLQNYKSNPFNTKKPSEPVRTKSKATYFLKQLNYNKTETSKYSLT